ncbi:MAG: hypothetical protein U1E46_02120 [Hyphomicrobiales bacterium]
MAVIALSEYRWVDPAALTAQIRTLAPMVPVHEVAAAGGTAQNGQNYLINLGDKRVVTVGFLDQPIPLETFANTVSPLTERVPLSPDDVEQHTANILVGALRSSHDRDSALQAAAAVTRTAAALTELVPAVAVYWAEADLLTSAAHFRDQAMLMVENYHPVHIWTSLRTYEGPPKEDGTVPVGMTSTGLIPFVGRDVDFAPGSSDITFMAQSLYAVMLHLLDKGPVFANGQAFALSDDHLLRIRLAESGPSANRPIYRLALEAKQRQEVV